MGQSSNRENFEGPLTFWDGIGENGSNGALRIVYDSFIPTAKECDGIIIIKISSIWFSIPNYWLIEKYFSAMDTNML